MIGSLTVVVPAYNEQLALRATLRAILAGLPALADCEVLVVDDGSTDGTAQIVREVAAEDRRVVHVVHERNHGKGRSLRTGFSRARCEWVLFLDADHQVRIENLAPLVAGGASTDAVVGYRTGRRDPMDRALISVLFRFLARWALGVTVRDVNCPFKLFRRTTIQALALRSDGFLIDAEILHRLRHRGGTVAEIPVAWHPRSHGSSTIRRRHLSELVRELVRLRLE